MVDQTSPTFGVGEAGAEIERIAREQIAPAAAIIDDAFARAAQSIQSNLSRAAARGEISLKKLAQSLTRDLGRAAIDSFIRKPIESLLSNALGAGFGGARANGGPVARGASYLVGERGPELFTPGRAGEVRPLSAAPVTVNIALGGAVDAESFRRSETQIAAGVARALARARRNA